MTACGMESGESTHRHPVTEGEVQEQKALFPTYNAYKAIGRDFGDMEEPSLPHAETA